MEIKYELPGKVDEDRLNRFMLPVGYVAEQVQTDSYHILTEDQRIQVGACYFVNPMVRVMFFNDGDLGRSFITAFGREHPESNPMTEFFGFVYQISSKGLYQLDTIPLRMRKEAVRKLKHYAASGNAYFVSFYRGDWSDKWLKVLSKRKILFDSSLGDEEGSQLLELGNIENEKTM